MLKTIDRTKAPEINLISSVPITEATISLLDNGIKLHSINAGFQDLVKIELIFPNSSFDPSNALIPSAANRMLIEGTTKFNAQQIADKIDFYGAYLETEESADYCSVHLLTLNKYLDNTLPLLKEVLTDAIFPQSELGVYCQNNKQRLMIDNEKVSSIARKKFNQLLYGNSHPYGYIVTHEDYDRLERNNLKVYHKSHYTSELCTMIVSGMVTDKTIQMINRTLGANDWGGLNGKSAVYPQGSSSESKVNFIPKEGAVQSAIRIGKVLINRTHPDFAGVLVLNTVLGGNFSSRLMSNLREEKGYTYGVGSALVSLKSSGYFFISTEVKAEVTNDAVSEIYKEIETLKKTPVEKEELEMVRNYLIGNMQKSFDGAFHLADRFKTIYLNGLTYDYYRQYLEKVRTIQADEIMSLAQKHLDSSSFYEVVVGARE